MLKDIKKDLEELRGATVKIFGQTTTIPNRSDDDITVDALHMVEALFDYEVTNARACKLLHVLSLDDVDDLEYETADNSYNWNGSISNDFNYEWFEVNNGWVMRIRFHRFGDVRGNYTDYAFLLFDDRYQFEELLSDQFNDFYVVVDKLEFSCTSRIYDEYVRCSAKTDTGYIDLDVCGYDKYDVLTELVNEMETMV